jgi:hypothetical protein
MKFGLIPYVLAGLADFSQITHFWFLVKRMLNLSSVCNNIQAESLRWRDLHFYKRLYCPSALPYPIMFYALIPCNTPLALFVCYADLPTTTFLNFLSQDWRSRNVGISNQRMGLNSKRAYRLECKQNYVNDGSLNSVGLGI